MATSEKNAEPLMDIGILKTKRVLLVENVIFENVMPSVMPFLVFRQVDSIYGEKTKGDKMAALLDIIDRLAKGSQYDAFNALLKAIGGTQPGLFQTLVGRAPTETETIFCVKEIVQDVKESIMKTGHCTDSELDEKISFEYHHVELSIVDRKSELESTIEVPHEYGDHLTRLQGTGRNISASDILSTGGKLREKVLVFGRPGVGKSTTTQWLARQWARGKWVIGVTLLFLLQVRFLTNVDVPITALELLTLYSLYQQEDMADSLVLTSWLKNPASRILIFVDGLDEIPGFARRMINTRKIGDLTQKAHPIDLVINILRGNLLPHSIVVSVSRPFLGLSNLRVNSKAEVLGLTSRKVTEYVERRYPEKANHILSVLEKKHILLSVCGITFYCMMISRLLSEGVILIDEEVQTYTRLMAFILVQYTSRKITGSDFSLETNPYLGKLSKMAFAGIFQSQEDSKLAKPVFEKKDLIDFNLSVDDLDCVKKTGVIQIREHNIGGHKSIVAEFFHLSGQEMLAVLHFISKSKHSDDVLHQLFAGGHFDMALIYTFGLHFDRTSKWVDELWTAMGSSNPGADTSITSQLSLFIDRLWKESGNKMKACQLLYEGQWVDKAKKVSSHIAPDGKLSIEKVTMTALDILAVDFVCKCSGALNSITLKDVNADATLVKVMMSTLYEHNLSSLQEINLSRNSIGADGVKAIADHLSEVGAEAVAASLICNTSLTKLNISDNEIGEVGAEAIAEALSSSLSLVELDISDNKIGDVGAKAVAEALACNASLTELNISINGISEVGAEAVAEALTFNTTLTKLDISSNHMRDVGAEAVAEALASNTSLTDLDISYNKILELGAEAIAEALISNTTLTELDISGNELRDFGAEAVAKALTRNTSITELNIGYNEIGEVGAMAIAYALTRNTSLTELDISNNEICDVGAQALSEALSSNMTHKVLDIAGYYVVLPHTCNTSLTKLNISNIEIGDFGAMALCEALSSNTMLTELDISYNEIGDVGAEALAEALTSNTTLTGLDISYNEIDEVGTKALGEMLKVNTFITLSK